MVAFAGRNLEGSVLKVSEDSNKASDGKAVSPLGIIVKNPASNKVAITFSYRLA
jgi:hypothetical protein